MMRDVSKYHFFHTDAGWKRRAKVRTRRLVGTKKLTERCGCDLKNSSCPCKVFKTAARRIALLPVISLEFAQVELPARLKNAAPSP